MVRKVHIDYAYYKGRRVGEYIADEHGVWLEKKVNYLDHHYRAKPGWACDVQHINKLESLGGIGVRLIARDHSCVWTASLAAYKDHRLPLNKGDGQQYLLPDAYWTYTETGKRGAA